MSQSSQLFTILKQQLKRQGISYAEVANILDLSESSVKRLFSKQHMSVNRLEQICSLLHMELTDLLHLMQKQMHHISQLTWEQEKKIVSDTKLMLVMVCAVNNWSFELIEQTYQIEKAELISLLLQLERLDLLQLRPDNSIRLLITPDFHWHTNGPVQRYFEARIQGDFINCRFDKPGELRVVRTGMLTRQSNEEMQEKINQLSREFSQRSQRDNALPVGERYGSVLLLAMRPWEIPDFDRLRRSPNQKRF